MASRDLIDSFVIEDADGQVRTRIVARVRDVGHKPTLALVDALREEAQTQLAPIGGIATITGVAYLIQEVNTSLTTQFSSSFVVALAVIGLMWFLGTRSVRRTFLALLPNMIPLLLLLALMGAAEIPLKPATAMVMSIGLSIAVDNTIHFLSAYKRIRQRGGDVEEGILHAFETAGRSMIDTSVMIVAGFSCLLLSQASDNQIFGLLAGWVVICAVLSDLLLLPPLLYWLDRRE
jgi:predicted RND superfamily exporter protein